METHSAGPQCASCGTRPYRWGPDMHPAGERAERLGTEPGDLICHGCRDAAYAMRPGMSAATRQGIVAWYKAFPDRVVRANRKLADKPATLLKPEKTGEAQSPHFRITLNPDHPDTPNRLAKLYKLGVQGSAVSFQEAPR